MSVQDLGSVDAICEMCKHREIRYVHFMEHPNYDKTLRVGCVCAGKMEGDYEAPQRRENELKNTTKRRKNWLKRQWRMSAKGNDFLNVDGFNIVIFQKSNGKWGWKITRKQKREDSFSPQSYNTKDEAKLAAFDKMIEMEKTWHLR